jgi:hypothetical protein
LHCTLRSFDGPETGLGAWAKGVVRAPRPARATLIVDTGPLFAFLVGKYLGAEAEVNPVESVVGGDLVQVARALARCPLVVQAAVHGGGRTAATSVRRTSAVFGPAGRGDIASVSSPSGSNPDRPGPTSPERETGFPMVLRTDRDQRWKAG